MFRWPTSEFLAARIPATQLHDQLSHPAAELSSLFGFLRNCPWLTSRLIKPTWLVAAVTWFLFKQGLRACPVPMASVTSVRPVRSKFGQVGEEFDNSAAPVRKSGINESDADGGV
jgi:hypothetical protein